MPSFIGMTTRLSGKNWRNTKSSQEVSVLHLEERRDDRLSADGQYVIEYPTPFNMEQESLALTGKHNMYNSLAAGITADIAGVKNEVIRQSLSDFEGVEHRLEKVVRVRGVDYINDSKATNVMPVGTHWRA